MVMISIEATIISTAMPQIAGELGGLHLYSWVFSSYLLAQTTTTVTVDCAKADEAERAIQVVSVDDGCNAAGGRGRDGTWLGFIAFGLFAFRRGRGRGRGVRA